MLTGERWRVGGDLRAAATRITIACLWAGGFVLTLVAVQYYAVGHRLVGDGHAYWLTGQDWYQPYVNAPNTKDAFLYSPAFAQLVWPFTALPWPAFAIAWVGAETAAFAWLLRPLGWRWVLPLLLWFSPELVIGNVLGFVAVALVLAIAHPSAWATMLLTKPTFGVGVLWHIGRGEWRRLVTAVAATGGIVAVSFAIDPEMWFLWVRFLSAHSQDSGTSFFWRVGAAVVVTLWAARTGRPWLLPVALLLATPVFVGSPSLTVLAAIPRLLRVEDAATRAPIRTGVEDDRRAGVLADSGSEDAAAVRAR